MIKMVDVAHRANVSVKTVSRVLNNEPHVQEVLRKKVLEAVESLGYIPSTSARNLRSNRSYTIHMLVHSLRSNFLNALQAGALSSTQKLGYRLVTSQLKQEMVASPANLQAWYTDLVKRGKPDGVILTPPYSNNQSVNEIISKHEIPIVRIGPNHVNDNNTTIIIDDKSAARDATNHLIELGHKRIAFVRGLEDQEATHERFEGFKDAMCSAGIEFDPKLIMPGQFDFESGLIAGHKLLGMANPPSAIFAANDFMAAGVLVSAHSLGVSVPDTLSIVGFDDSELSQQMWPALTTIRQPVVEFGESAVRILVSIAGKPKEKRSAHVELLNYELLVRQSTAPTTQTES